MAAAAGRTWLLYGKITRGAFRAVWDGRLGLVQEEHAEEAPGPVPQGGEGLASEGLITARLITVLFVSLDYPHGIDTIERRIFETQMVNIASNIAHCSGLHGVDL